MKFSVFNLKILCPNVLHLYIIIPSGTKTSLPHPVISHHASLTSTVTSMTIDPFVKMDDKIYKRDKSGGFVRVDRGQSTRVTLKQTKTAFEGKC